jgi:hypothetical protein
MAQKGNVVLGIAIMLIWGAAVSYYFVMAHAADIRANWAVKKCDPRVMPFAGIINAPDGQTGGEFTAANFSECLTETGKLIAADAIAPAQHLVSGLGDTANGLGGAMQHARNAVNDMRHATQTITDTVTTRTYNTALPLVSTGINTKSGLNKAQAVAGTGLFAAQGGLLMASTFVGATQEFLLKMALMFIATGTSLLAIPFCLGCPVGIPLIALGLAVFAVCIAVLIVVGPEIPGAGMSSCFPGNTIVITTEGPKKMCDLVVGDVLVDGGAITSTFIASSAFIEMFIIRGVSVSSTHLVQKNSGVFCRAEDHPEAVYDGMHLEPTIFCINTSTGEFKIGDVTFRDWDEWTEEKCQSITGSRELRPPAAGLGGEITVLTAEGSKKMKDVVVGDVLFGGARVRTVVTHAPQILRDVCLESGSVIRVTSRACAINGRLGVELISKQWRSCDNPVVERSYHLNTDREGFWLFGEKIANYDDCMDKAPEL